MNASSTTTYTPTPAVSTGIVAHALMGLGMHMAEHNLPLYLDVETPSAATLRTLNRLVIQLDAHTIDPWMSSIEVDDITSTRIDDSPFSTDFHVLGRLPGTGVRVDLHYLALAPAIAS